MIRFDKVLLKILRGTSDAAVAFSWEDKPMKANPRYEIILYWSNEDNTFIADVPELPGCMADGATY